MTWRRQSRPWLLALLCLVLASPSALLGCSRSEQGLSWEQEQAKASEAFRQGRYADAETRWAAALKKAEEFEVRDPRLDTTLDSFAFLYSSQLKYADAEPLYQRLLTIRLKVLGSTHPDVAKTLYNLAKLAHAQGQHDKAEPLYQRALAIHEKALGPTHADVAVILESYVALLRETNRLDEAAQFLAAHTKGDRGRGTLPICPD